MFRLQQVLAATDLSAPARHAAERAALLANEHGATLDLLHAAGLAPLQKLRQLVAGVPDAIEQRALDAAREQMHGLAAMLRQRYGVSAGVHVEPGSLLPELVGKAGAIAADLIVLGARGASFVRHLVLGSTAERLVSSATRPMLVVKQAARERYRTLLVPVDFSASSAPALRTARAMAPAAEIIVLHAFEVPFEGTLRFAGVDEDIVQHYRWATRDEAERKLQALCDEVGLAPPGVRTLVLHGEATRHIIEQEQDRDCDLIVVGKHGESVLEDLMLGSVTRHVLAESQCDVLVSV
jgi:nucleotide-binding universal stress UspA family protein